MYIKQVIIEGFKSYKDQTRTEPFSNKINAIVGANGAGKSNFFQAIRFVLDADARTLRQEERQKLLHEGAGHAVLNAYVEIVLDNSDGRIQFEKDEIRLRRTVGLKKDIYQLQKKNCTKTEVSDMLESAGFSKANPYYVVQQGKITALSTMEDGERLNLLKEIGGSKVYEDRRTESLQILHDAEGRKAQIAELVTDMEGKLKQLDAEKEELAKYLEVDKQRRSLEYAIYNHQVSDTRAKLDQIEQERAKEAEEAGKIIEIQQEAQSSLKRLARELKSLELRQKTATEHLAQTSAERKKVIGRQTELEIQIDELKESAKSDQSLQAGYKKQLAALEKDIAKAEKDLKKLEADLEQKKPKATALTAEVDTMQMKIQALIEKQGESITFATTRERDDSIKKSLKNWAITKEAQQKQIESLQREANCIEREIPEVKKNVRAAEEAAKGKQREAWERSKAKAELQKSLDTAQNRFRDCNQQRDTLKDEIRDLEEIVKSLEKKVAPGSWIHATALKKVKEIAAAHNIPIHGTILEVTTTMEQLYIAVEVAAGGALFHVVVDNDRQSSELLSRLAEDKSCGRVTVLPLNKLDVEKVAFPKEFGDDAKPLAAYLECDERLKKALQHVFGKWMICKDSEVASKVIADTNHINCVTIGGDKHEKKGKITGGHREEHRSKLFCYSELKLNKPKLEEKYEEQRQAIAAKEAIDAEKLEIQNKISNNELEHDLAITKRKELEKDAEQERNHLQHLESQLESKRTAVEQIQAAMISQEAQMQAAKQTLGSKELGKLSPKEQQEKVALQTQLGELTGEKDKAVREMEDASHAYEKKKAEFDEDLRPRQKEFQDQLAKTSTDDIKVKLQASQIELESVRETVKQLEEGETNGQQEVDSVAEAIQACTAEADSYREALKSNELSAEEEAAAANQLLQRRGALQQKKTDLEKKIRDLGSLPSEAFQKYQNSRPEELQRLLTKAQNTSKKYGHVNKKALDQYLNFTEQREELVRRHDETVRGKQKIQQLIQTLDLRKDEAIERTFKGVAKNFREVFAELAPGGRGELVMQKAARAEPATDQPQDEDQPPLVHERYSGVKVKVSFGGGETMSLKQLSGGQKTLVALALIFSIQRLDPAPFYLFDEIDAALDPSYRTTVAKMLAKQANDPNTPSQFIITTFHPQIINETDQIYGVAHSARISTIDIISRQDALDFLNTEEKRNGQQQSED